MTGFVFKIHIWILNIETDWRSSKYLELLKQAYYHVRQKKRLEIFKSNAFAEKKKNCRHLLSRRHSRITHTGNFKIGDTLTEEKL
jgi:hypothetical protein